MSFNKGLKSSILSPIYRFEWETKPGEESPSKQKELVIYPKVTGKMTPLVVKGRRRDFKEGFPQLNNSCFSFKWFKIIGALAQLARALRWQRRGHRFDSDMLHSPKGF